MRHKPKHDESRRHAKRDYVGKRVELSADGGLDVEQSRREAVEEIEDARDDNHQGSLDRHTGGDEQDRQTAREQVAARDSVGNVLFNAHDNCY